MHVFRIDLSIATSYTVECGVSKDLKGNLCCVITPTACLERLSKTTKLPQKYGRDHESRFVLVRYIRNKNKMGQF